jgi:antitoxin component YwqK of YwqJK toxin-antitoxin module
MKYRALPMIPAIRQPLQAGAGVALLILLLAGCARQAAEVPDVPEAAMEQLVRVGDRLVLEGESTPFSGLMVEFYPDGSRKARSMLQEGVLHGLSEGWFPDGVLQVQEHFAEGVSHGLRTRYHPNGVRHSEAEILKGELHGKFRRWHPNGNPAELTHFVRGLPHGSSSAYYASGYVRARVTLSEGRILDQLFFNDGEMADPVL